MKIWLSLMAIFLAANVLGAECCVLGEIDLRSDADQFHSFRARGGGFLRYDSPYQYMGVAAQGTHYSQRGWKRDAPGVLLLWRKQRRDTLAGTIAEAGLVRANGRARVVGDATWSLRPNARAGFELIAAGDLVETQRAVDRGIAYSFLAASAEREITPRFTVIALAGRQHFTDGNNRVHLRGRLIWMLVPEQGISAQLRYRQFGSDSSDVGGAYFNPRRYRQFDAGLFIRKRRAGWVYSGGIAPGREDIAGTGRTTAAIDARAEGPLWDDARIIVHASYNRSAGFAIAERYWYSGAGVTVVLPLTAKR
ncbi:MAG TPA: hypothetical protein VLU46_09585 [Thermoanaerobaculia bacterium]|nr:hypothetical protein [Thermoanaerobaculia bacterium]